MTDEEVTVGGIETRDPAADAVAFRQMAEAVVERHVREMRTALLERPDGLSAPNVDGGEGELSEEQRQVSEDGDSGKV